ncbi:MAG: hypothetical protein ACTJHU_09335 [Mycetocola sp.]
MLTTSDSERTAQILISLVFAKPNLIGGATAPLQERSWPASRPSEQ